MQYYSHRVHTLEHSSSGAHTHKHTRTRYILLYLRQIIYGIRMKTDGRTVHNCTHKLELELVFAKFACLCCTKYTAAPRHRCCCCCCCSEDFGNECIMQMIVSNELFSDHSILPPLPSAVAAPVCRFQRCCSTLPLTSKFNVIYLYINKSGPHARNAHAWNNDDDSHLWE